MTILFHVIFEILIASSNESLSSRGNCCVGNFEMITKPLTGIDLSGKDGWRGARNYFALEVVQDWSRLFKEEGTQRPPVLFPAPMKPTIKAVVHTLSISMILCIQTS